MTTGLISQGFQFKITGVTGGSFQSRTRQNVTKRIEKILYLESPPSDAVKLSYVGSSALLPANNLFIGDRSDSLYANSRTGKVQEFVGASQPVYVRNKNFITTQEFNDAESGSVPLYFKHILPLNIVAESVRVYDQGFEPVSLDKYKLVIQQEYDEDTGFPESPASYLEYHLYNNLESAFNPATGEYTVYFVQYTEVADSVEVTTTKLLSNELAYKQATFEDIWSLTLDLKPWSKAYILNSDSLSITLPLNTEYAVRYEESKRVGVKTPVSVDDVSPWFPRVIDGKFITGYAGGGMSYAMTYKIPEFENQSFNPMEPYKTAVRASCTKMDKHLIKLAHEDIQSGTLFSYFYMTVELDGAVQYAVTNDPYRVGDNYRDFENNTVPDPTGAPIVWSSTLLLGLDSLSGIVHVSFDVLDSYDIFANYSYKEEYYEVVGLNMNPVFDSTVARELRCIYLVPESAPNSNLGIQTASIQWLKIAQSGLILSTSQDGSGNNEDISGDVQLTTTDGYGLTGAIGLHYNWRATTTLSSAEEIIEGQQLSVSSTSTFPFKGWIRLLDDDGVMRYARFTDKTDTALILSTTSGEVAYASGGILATSGTAVELVNFVDERTTISNRDPDDEVDWMPAEEGFIPIVFSRYFLLAEMSINPPHSHQDAVFIDVREDGGGVRADKYEEAKQLNPEIQWFSDFGGYDGQPYPGDSVIVIKLPVNILDSYTEEQLRQIIQQSIPMGTKALIRYYGYTPNVTFVGPIVEADI